MGYYYIVEMNLTNVNNHVFDFAGEFPFTQGVILESGNYLSHKVCFDECHQFLKNRMESLKEKNSGLDNIEVFGELNPFIFNVDKSEEELAEEMIKWAHNEYSKMYILDRDQGDGSEIDILISAFVFKDSKEDSEKLFNSYKH